MSLIIMARFSTPRNAVPIVNPKHAFLIAALLLQGAPAVAQPADADEVIPELVVTSQRREQPRLLHEGNIERLDSSTIDNAGHQHVYELLTRVSGVWITRASGQEQLTAIRSPVLNGPGSCGAFLILEDGIPVRPAGFCNVNSLFELGTEFASAVEVIRGPGNALYGSNALHGIINVLMPDFGPDRRPALAAELGANDFFRVRAGLPFDTSADWLGSVVYADDGGFREHSGYRQGKMNLKRRWDVTDGEFSLGFSATDLDQDTAGYILGEDAYKDPALNRENLDPEAFRRASSQRLYGIWNRELKGAWLDVRPYLRHSDMEFLQHFLPGKPLEENGHWSTGAITTLNFDRPRHSTIVGLDLEYADMFLRETQDGPTEGSAFLVETRPQGKHYDYDVASVGAAAYVQSDLQLADRWNLGAGLRLDYLGYSYDNRMLTGNTRDDGTVCGFGGCLYSRPADRNDSFVNVAPKLSLGFALNTRTTLFANLARGFRAPQATELYRLQSGQQVADLESERMDSLEIGARTERPKWSGDIALYGARKRNSIYRDAEGFNVSGARSKHAGIEMSLNARIAQDWRLKLDSSYARHTYDFNVVAAQGETFVAGRDVDTAPRILGSLEFLYDPQGRLHAGLQWVRIGSYYLDAENRFRYPGHTIANLRVNVELGEHVGLILRLNNVSDRAIADRADYAFGQYRYFPGPGRELFAEFSYSP